MSTVRVAEDEMMATLPELSSTGAFEDNPQCASKTVCQYESCMVYQLRNTCDLGRISCHQVTSQRLEFPALRRREDSTIGLGG